MKKHIIFKAAIILLLQGCFAAKDYKSSDIDKSWHYRTDEIMPEGDSTMLAHLSWRKLFTDSLLVEYIEQGLQNNMDIRTAIKQVEIAEAYSKQAKLGYYPTLAVSAGYTHQELSGNSRMGRLGTTSFDQYDLTGDLTWEADIWGKIRSTDRAQQASYLRSLAAHKAVKTRLISDIVSAYYNLLTLDEQASITERSIETRRQSLETMYSLKESGEVSEVGVKQTEAQLYTAEATLVQLRNQIHMTENLLSILMGQTPYAMLRSSLEEQNIDTALSVGVPAELISNRPDVMAAELQVRNAFELTNVARSQFYPSFTLTASGGYQAIEFENYLDPESLFLTAIARLTQPVFNRRRIKTQYEVAQLEQDKAKIAFEQAVLTASREVSDALYAYKTAKEMQVIKENEFEANYQATQFSKELLNNGMANYLEVLNAAQNALNSSLDVANQKNQKLQSLVSLYRAVGGGWR